MISSVLLATLASLNANPLSAQDDTDINEQFERAGRFVRRGDLDHAIELYQELSRQAPDWADVWFNLAEVSRVAERPGDCVRYFRRYLYLVPDDSGRAQLEELVGQCAADMSESGQLVVSAQPEQARITVDGIELGRGALAPLALTPGAHEVVVEAAEYVAQIISVSIENGQTAHQSVTLEAVVHYGTLLIYCNEDGATVSIEDDVVGTTPLAEPIQLLANNPTLVQLTKEGFHVWLRRVEIGVDEESVLEVYMQEIDPWERQ